MFHIFRTVTARITILFMLLFSILALIMYVVVGHGLSKRFIKTIDAELDVRAHNTYKYVLNNYDKENNTYDLDNIQHHINKVTNKQGVNHLYIVLLDNKQNTILSSDLSVWQGLPLHNPELNSLPDKNKLFKTLDAPNQCPNVRVIYKKTSEGFIVQVGLLIDDYKAMMDNYKKIFFTTATIILLAGGIFGYIIARGAMSGVERVTETATHIGRGDLLRRVPAGREGYEIERLAKAFNEMLERIQGLVGELREVTNNIAHDLRSPVTRMRGIAETTLTGSQNVDDYQEMTGMIIEECDRMVNMINTMLEIAAADSGVDTIEMSQLDLAEVAESACELFMPVAEDAGIDLSVHGTEEPVFIRGNESRLQRVIANLLDNAIKFTAPGGKVDFSVYGNGKHAEIKICDTGSGIHPDDMSHIFERFYRGDRSRSLPGNGLGLSLAKSIVTAHGGSITVDSELGVGSAFIVYIPRTEVN